MNFNALFFIFGFWCCFFSQVLSSCIPIDCYDLTGYDEPKPVNVVKGMNNNNSSVSRIRRAVVKSLISRWPSPLIPYQISSKIPSKRAHVIKQSFKELEDVSCLKFRERTARDINYIIFQSNERGCTSCIGRQGGGQIINLGESGGKTCFSKRIIVHEILHALGFYHEHQRTDRDQYIKVNYDNITPRRHFLFDKIDADNLGVPYDIHSIMHYGPYFFSENSKPSIESKKPGVIMTKKPSELTESDIKKINILFKCKKKQN